MKYLIYGAYGYTGRLIVAEAIARGHLPVLVGRDSYKLEQVAKANGLESIAVGLGDKEKLTHLLRQFDLVIHAAGPYSATARPMIEACLESKTHYIDITGEVEVFEYIAGQHMAAVNAGIVMLPGAGFDVVPTDCMAAYLKEQLPDAIQLEMGFKGGSKISRGTALTMTESLHKGGAIRKDGKIVSVPNAYKSRVWDIEGKSVSFVSIPWGDVSTAYHSTGISDIVLYMAAHPKSIQRMKKIDGLRSFLGWKPVQFFMKRQVRKRVKGPDEQHRKITRSIIWGEVKNDKGDSVKAILNTPEGYSLTAMTSVEIAERILRGQLEPGFYTPSKAFGPDFILDFDGKRNIIQ
jgi:short subunit dehydrogenase-like uncharacterized protein